MTGSKTRKSGLSYMYNSPSALKKALAIQRIMSRKSIPEVKRIRMAAAIERYGAHANVNAVLAGENAESAEEQRKIRNAPNSKNVSKKNVSKNASKNKTKNASKNRTKNASKKNKVSKEKVVAVAVNSNSKTKKMKKWAPVATRGRVGM